MANWNYNPNAYSARNFAPIPEGDYRVRINNVREKLFSSGNEGFEITLDVPGHAGKLWYYLALDHNEPAKTNQRIGMFFDSFAIGDTNLDHYSDWIGRDGAVRVKHSLYNGSITARVVFCLSRSQQKKFVDCHDCYQKQPLETNTHSADLTGVQNRFPGFSVVTPIQREIPVDFQF